MSDNDKKYLSSDTLEKLEALERIQSQISTNSTEAKTLLLSTGIYETNGQLKPDYK